MRRFIRMAAVLAALAAPALTLPAAAQNTPAITVPELDDAGISAWQAKKNIYVKAINSTKRVEDSGKRYESWVDVAKGPSGKEKRILGLYSIQPRVLEDLKKAAAEAQSQSPAIPIMDQTLSEMAEALETLLPLINEAHGYYERKDFKDDDAARGKEIHPQLVQGFAAFIDARHRLSVLEDQLSSGLDRQALDKVERTSGKRLEWNLRNVLLQARSMLDFMPESVDTEIDLEVFDEKLKAFAEAVKSLDDYIKDPNVTIRDEASPPPSAREATNFLVALRDFRETYPDRKKKASVYQSRIKKVVDTYNGLINAANRTRFVVRGKR